VEQPDDHGHLVAAVGDPVDEREESVHP
jgi:hypothetical protein